MSESPQHAVLVPSVVSTFDFDFPFEYVEVLIIAQTSPESAVYFRTDGTAPVVASWGSEIIPGGLGFLAVQPKRPGLNTQVKVISAGAPSVSVRAW